MDLSAEQTKVEELEAQIQHTEKTLAKEKVLLEDQQKELRCSQDAQEVLQLLAQVVQQQAHAKINDVVSRCLSAVFDNPYQFKIVFDRKRGKTEASLRFIRDGMDVDPLSASGGGMIDVAAFALRVACLMLSRPRLSRVIVLDEPFKFVSATYRGNVRSMLEQLSEDLGIQIIMVTHIEELQTGDVVEL